MKIAIGSIFLPFTVTGYKQNPDADTSERTCHGRIGKIWRIVLRWSTSTVVDGTNWYKTSEFRFKL